MRTEGTEATSRRERLLIRREELEQLELLARSEHGVLLHRPRPQRPRGEGRHVRRVQTTGCPAVWPTNRRGDSVGSLAAAALRGFIERLAGVPGHVQACVT